MSVRSTTKPLGFNEVIDHLSKARAQLSEPGAEKHSAAYGALIDSQLLSDHVTPALFDALSAALETQIASGQVKLADLQLSRARRPEVVKEQLGRLLGLLREQVNQTAHALHLYKPLTPEQIAEVSELARANAVSPAAFQASAEEVYLGAITNCQIDRADALAGAFVDPAKGPLFDVSLIGKSALDSALAKAKADIPAHFGTAWLDATIPAIDGLVRHGVMTRAEADSLVGENVLHYLARGEQPPPQLEPFSGLVSADELSAKRRELGAKLLDLMDRANASFDVYMKVPGDVYNAFGPKIALLDSLVSAGTLTKEEVDASITRGYLSALGREGPGHPQFKELAARAQPSPAEAQRARQEFAARLTREATGTNEWFSQAAGNKDGFSNEGYEALLKDAAYYALLEGKSIPAQVLAEFPGLKQEDLAGRPAATTLTIHRTLGNGALDIFSIDLRRELLSRDLGPTEQKLANLFCDLLGQHPAWYELDARLESLAAVLRRNPQQSTSGPLDQRLNRQAQRAQEYLGTKAGAPLPLRELTNLRAQLEELLHHLGVSLDKEETRPS